VHRDRVVTAGGKINAPIGRHGQQRQRMAVMEGGKPAVSHYRVLERFRSHTHVRVKLETGRTHQIRVHMAHINFPLVGDPAYGGRFRIPPAANPTMVESLNTSRVRRCTRASWSWIIRPPVSA
jgi:23S rRNA pseudouridine1911/1915/1917 synthase